MSNLDSQRKEVQIVINFPIAKTFVEFNKSLSSCGYTYAYITHDKDTDSDGVLKTRHIHLVLSSLKRHRLKYFLNQVCEYLGVNENQVSIQPCDSFAYATQYLIHKNDLDKYQYKVTDIRTNLSEGALDDYLNEDVLRKLTTDEIIRLCVESRGNKLFIIQKLGIARYTLYRNSINDIFNSLFNLMPSVYSNNKD